MLDYFVFKLLFICVYGFFYKKDIYFLKVVFFVFDLNVGIENE